MQIDINRVNPKLLFCHHTDARTCPPADSHYPKRTVKWFEFEFILWGTGTLIVNGQPYCTKKGDLFFYGPGATVEGIAPYHSYLTVFDPCYSPEKQWLYDAGDFLNHERNLPAEKAPVTGLEKLLPVCFNVQRPDDFTRLFSRLYDQYIQGDSFRELRAKSLLLRALVLAVDQWADLRMLHNSRRSISANYPRIMEIKTYIDQHITARFTLADLARRADLSPNYLCKIFKSITGKNVVEYINEGKIALSKKQLLSSHQTVKEICYACGFENESYFYILFKKLEGISPSEYRRLNRLRVE